MKVLRSPKRLLLGKYYLLAWGDNAPKRLCKFIQPTKSGFNFLSVTTNKCILNKHVYKDKNSEANKRGDVFWFNSLLKITEIK